MNDLFKWLVYSSENPKKLSLTLQGAVATILPVALLLVHQLGFSLDGKNVEQIVLSAITVLTTAVTLFGLIRKFINTLKGKGVVAFTKTTKKKK